MTGIFVEERQMFHCANCQQVNERALIIDPAVRWWLDDTGEYWHEVAGVFLYNPAGEFLFFDRTKSPFGLTVPAGHVDTHEDPATAALRELGEEVGIHVAQSTYIATADVNGDKCRRGADVHRWHVFAAQMPAYAVVTLSNEGIRPVWLTLEQALMQNPTFAVWYVITHYGVALQQLTTR